MLLLIAVDIPFRILYMHGPSNSEVLTGVCSAPGDLTEGLKPNESAYTTYTSFPKEMTILAGDPRISTAHMQAPICRAFAIGALKAPSIAY